MATVLEKCGITNQIISNLKRRGLFVPREVKPVKKHFRSPSEEWFYQAADRFTPPLSKKERTMYIKDPKKFCNDLIKGVKFFAKVCGTLYDAFKNAKEKLNDEEAAAAILAILRIFHASIDYNYLKYDRHLEYHDYKESPVGYHWSRLKRLCLLAAKCTKLDNPKNWADEKVLHILSGFTIVTKATKGKLLAKEAVKDIIRNLKHEYDIKEFKKLLKIFRQLSIAQEKEGAIFYGFLPNKQVHVLDAEFHSWMYLKELLKRNPDFIKENYRRTISDWFNAEDPPSIIVAGRKLVQKDVDVFTSDIEKLYLEELKRWF